MRGTDASLYIPQIAALAWGDFVNVDCAARHHIALLTPEPLLRVGLSPAARCFAGNDAASARNLSASLGYRKQLDGVGLDQV